MIGHPEGGEYQLTTFFVGKNTPTTTPFSTPNIWGKAIYLSIQPYTKAYMPTFD